MPYSLREGNLVLFPAEFSDFIGARMSVGIKQSPRAVYSMIWSQFLIHRKEKVKKCLRQYNTTKRSRLIDGEEIILALTVHDCIMHTEGHQLIDWLH